MEIGFRTDIPTYSGGLGVLAGDTLKSASDLSLPVVAVSLLYNRGYFRQRLNTDGWQSEEPVQWNFAEKGMKLLPNRVKVQMEGRNVTLQAWRYDLEGESGGIVPLIFLDSDLPENHEWDRGLTYHLYGGDERYRLKQEVILGIGGTRMLASLGYSIEKYHMNEGHAALLVLELLLRHKLSLEAVWDESQVWDIETVRDLCIFTTHTPVEAGHDRFGWDLTCEVLGDYFPHEALAHFGQDEHDRLNMTVLALNLSGYHNGVAKKHGEVSKNMFPGYDIRSVTNGVHSRTWTEARWAGLYDKYIPGWSAEPELFVRVDNVPDGEIWGTHQACKKDLLDLVKKRTGVDMSPDVLTIGFARRATPYKRADLLFRDVERLAKIAGGKLQIIYAGKAHPKDGAGKENIHKIIEAARKLGGKIPVVFLENYDMALALQIIAGVDVWLNTPMRPREASGTSGMKATHNGVPNFSVLDGWWIEGWVEDVTGWSIGPAATESNLDAVDESLDLNDLYDKLEKKLLPLYYAQDDHAGWIKVMKGAVGKNACYFNTHRMMRQYVTEAYIR
jgi:starch phosphorylase